MSFLLFVRVAHSATAADTKITATAALQKYFQKYIRYTLADALRAMQQQRALDGTQVRVRGGSEGAAPTYVQ